MRLTQLKHTCSMYELTDISLSYQIEELKSFSHKKFRKRLSSLLEESNNHNGYKCIIYNSTNQRITFQLLRLGFKRVNKYEGWSNVTVLMYNTDKPCLFNRIIYSLFR